MSLPTLTKTWNTATVNLSVVTNASGLTLGRPWARAFKERMKALPNFPPTIKGSSNAVTAGMDGTDRLAADADYVWVQTSGNHSWWVFEYPQINDGAGHKLQVCFDLTGNGTSSGSRWQLYASPVAGFTGGSISARPTATDEVPIVTSDWAAPSVVHRLNFICSTDGTIFHFLSVTGNLPSCWLMVAKPFPTIDAVPAQAGGWNYPWLVATSCATGQSAMTAAFLYSVYGTGVNQKYYARHAATTIAFGFEPEGGKTLLQSGGMANGPHGVSGVNPILGFGIWSNTPGVGGRYGFIPDAYAIGDSSYAGYGATVGADDNHRQWLVAGSMLLPWTNDATVPLGS
jgi:hypothetical protein